MCLITAYSVPICQSDSIPNVPSENQLSTSTPPQLNNIGKNWMQSSSSSMNITLAEAHSKKTVIT